MSETGNLEANARKLGYKVTKKSSSIGGSSIVYYNVSKGDRETVLTSEAEIADFIKSDITPEEIQDLYKTGAIVGVEGNSMEGY